MKTIHMMQCMYIHKMYTVMHGMKTDSNCFLEENTQIWHQTVKKDDCTELANVTMPTNPRETGNLRKVLTVKINTRVMITTNIDVIDGLTNGIMGTVRNVVIDQTTGKMSVMLVAFDSEHVGQETMYKSVYNSINQNAVPIHQTQATFPLHKNIISSN